MKSDEMLVPDLYWNLKAGQMHWSDILALNMDDTNKYLVIFLKRVLQWFCAFECQLVLCAAVQNLSCSPNGGVKDALEWKDFSQCTMCSL